MFTEFVSRTNWAQQNFLCNARGELQFGVSLTWVDVMVFVGPILFSVYIHLISPLILLDAMLFTAPSFTLK